MHRLRARLRGFLGPFRWDFSRGSGSQCKVLSTLEGVWVAESHPVECQGGSFPPSSLPPPPWDGEVPGLPTPTYLSGQCQWCPEKEGRTDKWAGEQAVGLTLLSMAASVHLLARTSTLSSFPWVVPWPALVVFPWVGGWVAAPPLSPLHFRMYLFQAMHD